MKITNIQTDQGAQNTAHPVDKSNQAVDKRTGLSDSRINSGGSSPKIEKIRTRQVQPQIITASINYIKEQLDRALVHYPPFFPIAKYQRLDLIKKIKGIQEDIENLSIDENFKKMFPEKKQIKGIQEDIESLSTDDNLKKMFSGKKLPAEATDNEISSALDKLFHLREKLTKKETVSSDAAKIGSALDIKV